MASARVRTISLVVAYPTLSGKDKDQFHFFYKTSDWIALSQSGVEAGYGAQWAVLEGDWKLIEFFEDNHVELYNLKADIGEQTDLAAKMPEKARELRAKLAAWRRNVGAQLPTPNPDYDAAKDGARDKKSAARAADATGE